LLDRIASDEMEKIWRLTVECRSANDPEARRNNDPVMLTRWDRETPNPPHRLGKDSVAARRERDTLP
jgi:hypothetical protein